SLTRAHALARLRKLVADDANFILLVNIAPQVALALEFRFTSMSKSKKPARQSACEPSSAIYRSRFTFSTLGWWNGRHVRLRGVCRKACGFKSRPEHQTARSTSFAGQLFDLAFIAYGFCSLLQEFTSHRGKKRVHPL